MQATSVSCNHCGAALDVGPGARFATCGYCGSRLEIHRTVSAVYTEVLDRLDQRTEQIAEDVDALRRHAELEALDREWQLRREGMMTKGKDGKLHRPTAAVGLIGAVVMGAFGLLWTIVAGGIAGTASGMGAPSVFMVFPLFGVVFIVAAVGTGISTVVKAGEYQRAEEAYQKRRAELLRELEERN